VVDKARYEVAGMQNKIKEYLFSFAHEIQLVTSSPEPVVLSVDFAQFVQ